MPIDYYKGKFSGYEIDKILTEMDELFNFYNRNKMKFVYSDDIRSINVVQEKPEIEDNDILYIIEKASKQKDAGVLTNVFSKTSYASGLYGKVTDNFEEV